MHAARPGEVHIHLPKPYDTDFDHDLAEPFLQGGGVAK